MSATARAAVVVLNWNGRALLERFLPPLLAYTPPGLAEVVVADNHSTDGSFELASERFPRARWLQLDQNHGFAKGYNLALAQLEHEWVVLLNSDVEVAEGWLEPLLARLEAEPDLAAVSPKVRSQRSPELFEDAGAAGGFIDHLGYTFCRGRLFERVEADGGQYDDPRDCFWASGACMAIRRELFLAMGGFDEDFVAHMEEIDLCWRLLNAGWRIGFCPGSAVFHVGGASLRKGSPRKTFLNFRNNLSMMVKNLPRGQAARKVLVRLALDLPAALRFLAQGEARLFAAVLRAHLSFYARLPRLLRQRRALLGARPGRELAPGLVYPKSVVWQAFFHKKEKFSDLGF